MRRLAIRLAVAACCCCWISWSVLAVEWISSPDIAFIRAKDEAKDVLFLYSADAHSSEPWQTWLSSIEANQSELAKCFVFCLQVVPQGKILPLGILEMKTASQAAKHGVRQLPATALCDASGKIYALTTGGAANPKEAEALAKRLVALRQLRERRDEWLAAANAEPSPDRAAACVLKGLESVPVDSWGVYYPASMEILKQAGCQDKRYLQALNLAQRIRNDEELAELIRQLPTDIGVEQFDRYIKMFNQFLDERTLETSTRQCVLAAYVFPLYVKKCAALYERDQVNTPELEEAFNRSIETIEKARDLDRDSWWGRMAHQVREELRKKRLEAARFD